MLHGHLGGDGGGGGECEGPCVDYLCTVGVDDFDSLSRAEQRGDAVASWDCGWHFDEIDG